MTFWVVDDRHAASSGNHHPGRVVSLGSVKAYGEADLADDFFRDYVKLKGTEIDADDRRDAVDRYLQVKKVARRIEASL